MKPMLLERKNPDVDSLSYPLFVSPKLDGIRCLITDNGPKSRTLKDIPNKYIQEDLKFMSLKGLDGELIVGRPSHPNVFNTTTSAVRRVEGVPEYHFFAFDMWDSTDRYSVRIAELEYFCANLHPRVVFLPSTLVDSPDELRKVEQDTLDQGYEGIIIRSPNGLYKFGRTTMKEGNAYKLKRFEDSEAFVLGVVPRYRNENPEFTNELGRTARSKRAEGLIEEATMGALLLRDCATGVEFQCGSGFSEAERLWWYHNWERADANVVTYKKFLIGEKDKPRHPIFKGIRAGVDV